MKLLLLLLALLPLSLTGACIALAPSTVPTDGAMGRQIDRLVERHDEYVLGDVILDPAAIEAALAESRDLRALASLGSVERSTLRASVAPVAARHDVYVQADASLDAEQRATYLATTAQLARVLSQ